jgi:hypothetical protein
MTVRNLRRRTNVCRIPQGTKYVKWIKQQTIAILIFFSIHFWPWVHTKYASTVETLFLNGLSMQFCSISQSLEKNMYKCLENSNVMTFEQNSWLPLFFKPTRLYRKENRNYKSIITHFMCKLSTSMDSHQREAKVFQTYAWNFSLSPYI